MPEPQQLSYRDPSRDPRQPSASRVIGGAVMLLLALLLVLFGIGNLVTAIREILDIRWNGLDSLRELMKLFFAGGFIAVLSLFLANVLVSRGLKLFGKMSPIRGRRS